MNTPAQEVNDLSHWVYMSDYLPVPLPGAAIV